MVSGVTCIDNDSQSETNTRLLGPIIAWSPHIWGWPSQTSIILFTAPRPGHIPAKIGDLRLGQIPPPSPSQASLPAAPTASQSLGDLR